MECQKRGRANEGEVIRLETLAIIKESLLNYIYFSALLPHWLWLNETKETSLSGEPTTCHAVCWELYIHYST